MENSYKRIFDLINKDFVISGKYSYIVLLSFILYSGLFYFMGNSILFVNIIIVSGLSIAITFVEEKYNSEIFFCTLPLKRSDIVIGRYFTSLIISIIGAVLTFLVIIFFDRFSDAKFPFEISLELLVNFWSVIVIILSLYLPFFFRFGNYKGLLIFGLSISITLVLSILLSYVFLRKFNEMSLSEYFIYISNSKEIFINYLLKMNELYGKVIYNLLVILLISGIFISSIFSSIKIYKNKEIEV